MVLNAGGQVRTGSTIRLVKEVQPDSGFIYLHVDKYDDMHPHYQVEPNYESNCAMSAI